ncbi:MAG: protein-glutamate O-methyltransferase CheR [Nitrospirota bacterium]|jgi:chemotaxis protein methyltransferase CheR
MVPFQLARLSDGEFRLLGGFIQETLGIKMPPVKKTLLEGRLQKRLRLLGLQSFSDYCTYLFSSEGMTQEAVHMLDTVTTNKTEFFREGIHFRYLRNMVLPQLVGMRAYGPGRPLRVWSAGCSTGEEPYTIAMALNEYAEQNGGLHFSVLATDVSSRALEKARCGIYEEEKISPVSEEMRGKYFLRSKDRAKCLVKVVPELRERVVFTRVNLMDEDYGLTEPVEVIFCRNVMIYFDRPTQRRLVKKLCGHLIAGGYVFIGHSETLNGLSVPLVQVAPTLYRKNVR